MAFFKSIKGYLLLLFFVSILPALAIITYSSIERHNQEIANTESDALFVLSSFAIDHERTVSTIRHFLITLSTLPQVRNQNGLETSKIFSELIKQNPLLSSIFAVNEKGVRFASGRMHSTTPENLSHRKYFVDALKTMDFSAGEAVTGVTTKEPSFHFSYPIKGEKGEFKGIVAVTVDIAKYARIFPVYNLPQGSFLSITDHRGILTYRYPDQNGALKPDSPEVIELMLKYGEEGKFTYKDSNNIEYLKLYRRFHLKKNDPPYLFIRVSIPKTEILKNARKSIVLNIGLMTIALASSLILAMFLGNHLISNRLKKLADVSRRLGGGDFKARTGVQHTDDEIGRLASAFDWMADTLESKEQEQKNIEHTLQKIARDWQETFDAIGDMVMILDERFHIVRCNRATSSFLNLPIETIPSKTCFSLMHGTEDPPSSCPFEKMMVSKTHEETEFYDAARDRWYLVSVSPIFDEEGNISGAVHIVKDITEHKRYEVALAESEEKYRILVENSLIGFCIIQDERYKFVNQAFCDIYGYSREELIEKMDPKITIHPDDRERVLENRRKRISGEVKNLIYEFKGIRKDGQIITVKVFGSSIIYNGRPASVGMVIDITKEKLLESQLIQAQKMEAIGALAGGVAHDFNNLLMTILGYASLMLVNKDPHDPDYEKLKTIEEQVISGAKLTKQLLGFARGGKYEVKPTNLNEILTRSADMFGRTKKEIRIHKKLETNLWITEVDRGQMEQVFLNLFLNAWQAMPGGGDLYLETGNVTFHENMVPLLLTPGRYIKISVSDTGIGMDEATKQRIFEPFFTTKGMGKGTGLGLASVYGIIKNHNGAINVYSEKGKGATFTLYLPATENLLPLEEDKRDTTLIKGSGNILIIDDQEDIIKVASEMIKMLGYGVFMAQSGEDAIEIYKTKKDDIALVILDMVLPGMGGGDIYDRLKGINPEIKVILSSGYSLNGQAVSIMKKGCNGFIQKPFTLIELSRKIKEVLG
ncbi:MAG: PAS domain S-box protein [Syntrophorhabdaceae bacterium]|nr:PAS domain S-box protein [Syntrophorhabdaceae bacterium]